MDLREIEIQDRIMILHENKSKDGDVINVLVPWTQADKKNKNGRIYPLALLQREVAKVQKDIEAGGFLGTADHPSSGLTNLESVSHIVKKLWLDKDGRGWGEMKILPTTKGKNLQTVIREGGRLGVSSRGYGNVHPKTGIVQNDFKLSGVDIVVNPSEESTYFSKENIFESVNFETEKKSGGSMNIDKLCEMSYGRDIDEGTFSGSLEEWKKEHEIFIRAAVLQVEEDISLEEALKKLGADEAIERLKREEGIPKKVTSAQVFAEARIANVDPIIMAERINKNIEIQEKTFLSENLAKRKTLYQEMLAAGIEPGKINERIEKINKLEEESQKEPKPLTEEERKELEETKKKQKRQSQIDMISKETALAGGTTEDVKRLVKEIKE